MSRVLCFCQYRMSKICLLPISVGSRQQGKYLCSGVEQIIPDLIHSFLFAFSLSPSIKNQKGHKNLLQCNHGYCCTNQRNLFGVLKRFPPKPNASDKFWLNCSRSNLPHIFLLWIHREPHQILHTASNASPLSRPLHANHPAHVALSGWPALDLCICQSHTGELDRQGGPHLS